MKEPIADDKLQMNSVIETSLSTNSLDAPKGGVR